MSMFKSIPVSYPKRRKKKNEHIVNEIQEPTRTTMYDIAMDNFRRLKRVTYMHRIIYAGEHSFVKNQSDLESFFHAIVKEVNDSYTPEKLTGFFLCYSKYFIHMIEGDEDSINNHLRLLLKDETRTTHLGPIKLLIHLSHVSRRLVKDWSSYYGTPAQYLGKINVDSGLDECARQVYNCIRKTYNLIFLCVYQEGTDSGPPKRMSIIKPDIRVNTTFMRMQNQYIKASPMDPYRSMLPEQEIVDFVIKTNFTEDIEKYFSLYGLIPQRLIYEDRIWPCPSYNIPYDVFSQPYETITELSKIINQEEEEEEEEKEKEEEKREKKQLKKAREDIGRKPSANIPRSYSF